jgi:hypothetical protein
LVGTEELGFGHEGDYRCWWEVLGARCEVRGVADRGWVWFQNGNLAIWGSFRSNDGFVFGVCHLDWEFQIGTVGDSGSAGLGRCRMILGDDHAGDAEQYSLG